MTTAGWSSYRLPIAADGLALGAGALLPLAFSPYGLGPLAVPLMALLFGTWLYASPRRALWRGWLFGCGLFGAGVHWVYHSMHVFGGMTPAFAGLVTALFVLLLALFPALAGWLATRFAGGGPWLRALLVFPAVWTLVEWLRGWFLTGFPWLDLGYSQVSWPLAGLASVTGTYGVTWAAAFSGGLLIVLVGAPNRARLVAAVCVILLWLGGWLLGRVDWTRPAGPPLSVSLVQGDTPQALKWQPGEQQAILAGYAAATRAHWSSRLVVWPETAVPAFYRDVRASFLQPLAAEARAHDTDLLLGLPVQDPVTGRYYNAMVSLGDRQAFYYKRHLVPFGEYIPLQDVLHNLLDLLHVPMSDFSPGPRHQPPLLVAGYPVGISICYEIAFADDVLRALPQAAFLVNASNNAWFGNSSAPYQVLEMARMRALETQRYVLSATNNGMTAIIDDRGRVVKSLPRFAPAVLTGTLQPRRGATPYVRVGDHPVVVTAVLVWIFGPWLGRGRAQRE